jgi:hypothetical protein
VQRAGDLGDLLGSHVAFIRTAEDGGDVAAHFDIVLFRFKNHRGESFERLGDRAVDVLLRERLGGRGEHRDLGGAGRARRLEALEIGREHRIGDARPAADAFEDLGVVGHLRHPLRRDEGGRLDRRQAGVGEALDQLELDRGRHLARLVLQPVARPHLDQSNFSRQLHSSLISSAPSSTCSPSP